MNFDPANSTLENRKALFDACFGIRKELGLSWDDFFEKAGIAVAMNYDDNLRKGKIGIPKFITLHRWIVAHHLESGVRYAPEIFDLSQASIWQSVLASKGVWDSVDVHPLDEINLGCGLNSPNT